MLVLSRRIGEDILIGDPRDPVAVIRVCGVDGHSAFLSFTCALDVPIAPIEFGDLESRPVGPDSTAPTQTTGGASDASALASRPCRAVVIGKADAPVVVVRVVETYESRASLAFECARSLPIVRRECSIDMEVCLNPTHFTRVGKNRC